MQQWVRTLPCTHHPHLTSTYVDVTVLKILSVHLQTNHTCSHEINTFTTEVFQLSSLFSLFFLLSFLTFLPLFLLQHACRFSPLVRTREDALGFRVGSLATGVGYFRISWSGRPCRAITTSSARTELLGVSKTEELKESSSLSESEIALG